MVGLGVTQPRTQGIFVSTTDLPSWRQKFSGYVVGGSELCKKTGTITRGVILKSKMADMEAAMYVKPSPFTRKCTTIKSSIYLSRKLCQVNN